MATPQPQQSAPASAAQPARQAAPIVAPTPATAQKPIPKGPEQLEDWLGTQLKAFVGMEAEKRDALFSEITEKLTKQGNAVIQRTQDMNKLIAGINNNRKAHAALHRFTQRHPVSPGATLRVGDGTPIQISPLQSISVQVAHNRLSNYLVPAPYSPSFFSKEDLEPSLQQAEFTKELNEFKLCENENAVISEYLSKRSDDTTVDIKKKIFDKGKYRGKFIGLQETYLQKLNSLLGGVLVHNDFPLIRSDFETLKSSLVFDTRPENYTETPLSTRTGNMPLRTFAHPDRREQDIIAREYFASTKYVMLRNKTPEQRGDAIKKILEYNFNPELPGHVGRAPPAEVINLGSVQSAREAARTYYYWRSDPKIVYQYIQARIRNPGQPLDHGGGEAVIQGVYTALNAIITEHRRIFEVEGAIQIWEEELDKLNKGVEVQQAKALNDQIKQAAESSLGGGQNLDDTSKEYAPIVEKLCGVRAKLFWYAPGLGLDGGADFVRELRKRAHFYGRPYYPWMDTSFVDTGGFCKMLEFKDGEEESALSGEVKNMDDVYEAVPDVPARDLLLYIYDIDSKGFLSREQYKLMMCRLGWIRKIPFGVMALFLRRAAVMHTDRNQLREGEMITHPYNAEETCDLNPAEGEQYVETEECADRDALEGQMQVLWPYWTDAERAANSPDTFGSTAPGLGLLRSQAISLPVGWNSAVHAPSGDTYYINNNTPPQPGGGRVGQWEEPPPISIYWSSYLDYRDVSPPELPKLPLELETYRTEVLPLFELVRPDTPIQQSILNMWQVNKEINDSIMTLFTPASHPPEQEVRNAIILQLQHKPLREVLLALFYDTDFEPQGNAVNNITDTYLLPFCYGEESEPLAEIMGPIATNRDALQDKFSIYVSREQNEQVFNQFWGAIHSEGNDYAEGVMRRFKVTTSKLLDLIYKIAGPIQEHFQKITIESSSRGTTEKLESMAHKYGLYSLKARTANETLFMNHNFPVTPIVHLRLKEQIKGKIPEYYNHLRVYDANNAAFKRLLDALEKNKVDVRKWSEWWVKKRWTPGAISRGIQGGISQLVPTMFYSLEKTPITAALSALREAQIGQYFSAFKKEGVTKINEFLKMSKKYEGGLASLMTNAGNQDVKGQNGGASSSSPSSGASSVNEKFTPFGLNIVNKLAMNEDEKYRLLMAIDSVAEKMKKEYNEKQAQAQQGEQGKQAATQQKQGSPADEQDKQMKPGDQAEKAATQPKQGLPADEQDNQVKPGDQAEEAATQQKPASEVADQKGEQSISQKSEEELTEEKIKEEDKTDTGEESIQNKLIKLLSSEEKSADELSLSGEPEDNPRISRIYRELERLRKENLALKNEREDLERSGINHSELMEFFKQGYTSQGNKSDIAFQKYDRALQRVSELKEEQGEVTEKHALNLIQDKLLSEKREKINEDAKVLLGQLNILQENKLREKVNYRRALIQNEGSETIMAYPVEKAEGTRKAKGGHLKTPRKRNQRRRRRRSVSKKVGV